MVGYSWEETRSDDSFGVTVKNFYNDAVKYYNLSYANAIDGMDGVSSGAESTLRLISLYGRLNYSFNSKYNLQATIRRDGSSAFGTNNRWATFPSVSAAWRISEEDFMKDGIFEDLKLRAGYGVSRNDMIRFGTFESDYGFHKQGFPNARFEKTCRVFPVPQSVLNENTNWQQNPGY